MSAFIIFIGTEEKRGVLNPSIVGPFDSHEAAEVWLAEGESTAGWYGPTRPEIAGWFDAQASMYGGYPTIHIVSERTAEDPTSWLNGASLYMDEVEEGE